MAIRRTCSSTSSGLSDGGVTNRFFQKALLLSALVRAIIGARLPVPESRLIGPRVERHEEVLDLVQAHVRTVLHQDHGEMAEAPVNSALCHGLRLRGLGAIPCEGGFSTLWGAGLPRSPD